MSADTSTPKPTTYTHVKDGQRSMQYYAIRTRWKWKRTEKTRCWTTIMKSEWGDDLDAITLLGIEPKPVERDWRRYDELRELVDLGRNQKISIELLRVLERDAEREQQLRATAERRASVDVPKRMTVLIDDADSHSSRCRGAISNHGVAYALRMKDFDQAVKADFTSGWASEVVRDIETKLKSGTVREEDEDSVTKDIVRDHMNRAAERLINGENGDRGYCEIGGAVSRLFTPALVAWHKTLSECMAKIDETEKAQETLHERNKLAQMDKLVSGIGGVSSSLVTHL